MAVHNEWKSMQSPNKYTVAVQTFVRVNCFCVVCMYVCVYAGFNYLDILLPVMPQCMCVLLCDRGRNGRLTSLESE